MTEQDPRPQGQHEEKQNEEGQPRLSRRRMLVKSAWVAPAILAFGSVPTKLAHAASPPAGEDGDSEVNCQADYEAGYSAGWNDGYDAALGDRGNDPGNGGGSACYNTGYGVGYADGYNYGRGR